jgi:hypothetical protein
MHKQSYSAEVKLWSSHHVLRNCYFTDWVRNGAREASFLPYWSRYNSRRALVYLPMYSTDIGSVEWLTLVGQCVERRFFRAFLHKVYSLTDGGSMKRQLQAVWVLRFLEGDINIQNAPTFVCPVTLSRIVLVLKTVQQSNLEAFLIGLDRAEIRYLTSFHAVTTVFEYFTLYLVSSTKLQFSQ